MTKAGVLPDGSTQRGAPVMLVGMMGAGKTTVGRLVASRLGWQYFDSDASVQEATGLSVPQLFAEKGEAAFRAAEAQALREALSPEANHSVISVAGGAVLDPQNRRLISNRGTVVWLRATPQTLAERVGDGAGRPLLSSDPEASLAELDKVRRPLYEELADAVIDVDDLDPSQVADRVIAALNESAQ